MNEESKIASIKSKYKDVNDIDADIQYNQETREYVVIDKNNNIVKTFKSLDEELEQFEQAGRYVPYDNSRVNENSSNSNRKLNNKSNDKIDIYFSVMANIISAIRSMASSINDCDTSYANCLTGELRNFYNTLNDNTPEAIKNLLNLIMGAASVTESSVSLCYDMGIEILKELEALISGFSQYAQNANNPLQLDTSSDEPLNYDDYAYFFDNINEIFDGRYEDIINNFKFNLAIGYQKLLEVTIPKTIDNIIENTYLRNCNEEIGSEKYYEGLKTFKDSFGKNILSHYDMEKFDIEESNIPAYLWEDKDADNYQKSLLMLSYNGEFDDNYEKMIKGSINNACDEIGIYIKDLSTFDNDVTQTVFGFKEITDYYNRDFDKETEGLSYKEQIKRILEITKEVRYPFESENDRVSKYTMESAMFPNLGGNVDTGKCFVDTLKELHYFDNLSKEYDDKTLYENTFNYEFLTNIAVNEGTDKVYSVIEKYYDKCFQAYGYQDSSVKAKELAKQLFQETPFASNFTTANMTNGILNNINYSYDKLSNDKVTLDASKANFKLGLLESLDTSSITNADVADARKLIGNDAKYLEEWQIKGYYKIYQEDKERAKELLNDTLYNIIQDGRGYAKAKDIYEIMQGNPSKEIMNQITHDEIFSDVWGKTSGFIFTTLQGFGDGVVGSVRNVADVAFADGKMNSDDYYLSYLQKMLSAGGFHNDILKLNYDLSSSVGNMTIPMALSAFVSPHAMTAWIALAETGSEREQALRHGEEDNAMTWANAIAKGLLAAGFEKKLGALKGYGAKEGELLKIFTKDNTVVNKLMNTSLGKKIAYAISASVNETFEELGENVGGYGIDLLTGRDIDWQNVPQETWQTIYMTMLSTPFINMMGEGFQNNKHSIVNRQETHNFNGFNVEYSQAELLQFTDGAGKVDKQGFFKYLMENKRFKDIKNSIKRLFGINQTTSFDIDSNNDVNNEYVDIRRIINGIMSKSNCSRIEAAKILESAIMQNNFNFITRNGNAREIAGKYTYNQLNEMLLSLKNLNLLGEQYDLFSVITRKNDDSTYKKPSELFREIGETTDTTYGVNQGGLLYLTSVIDENGNVLSASQAMKKIQDCQNKGLPLPHFSRRASKEYDSVKNFLVDNYGMSKSDASILLTSVDDKGACSYASVANEIFTSFIGKEQEFQKKFGFSMYDAKTNKPNYNQLLADLYLNYNTDDYGGKLLSTDAHGNVVIDKRLLSSKLDPLGRHILDASNQMYLSTAKGKDDDRINRYLGMKGIEYKSSVLKKFNNYKDNQKITSLAKKIQNGLKNGKSYSMGVYSHGSDIHFISTDGSMHNESTRTWNEGDGHSVFISNVTDDGIIVASWGHEFLIPFNDLKDQKAMWLITESDIVVK